MRSGNLTVKVSKSINPQAKGYYRLNGSFNKRPAYNNAVFKSGDVLEVDLLDNIDLINRVVNHDNLKVLIATEGRAKSPVINADTISIIKQHYEVEVDR
jgi:hypothetical protein